MELIGDGTGHTVEKRPDCFRAAIDIYRECTGDDKQDILAVLNRERECDKFYRYRPGFSPREHSEMLFNESMLEKQEQRLVEERRWRDEQAKLASDRHRHQIWFLGIFIAIATLLAPIIGALIANYISGK